MPALDLDDRSKPQDDVDVRESLSPVRAADEDEEEELDDEDEDLDDEDEDEDDLDDEDLDDDDLDEDDEDLDDEDEDEDLEEEEDLEASAPSAPSAARRADKAPLAAQDNPPTDESDGDDGDDEGMDVTASASWPAGESRSFAEARSDSRRLDEGLEETFPASDPVSAKHIS
jgi:hypothetical protein